MEGNITNCKICLKPSMKISLGKYHANSKDKRYCDELGRNWNGRRCPDCETIRVREAMKKTRSKTL